MNLLVTTCEWTVLVALIYFVYRLWGKTEGIGKVIKQLSMHLSVCYFINLLISHIFSVVVIRLNLAPLQTQRLIMVMILVEVGYLLWIVIVFGKRILMILEKESCEE